MAERLTVDQKAVGSTPIAHPKDSLMRSLFVVKQFCCWILQESFQQLPHFSHVEHRPIHAHQLFA
jgi:hypothetical protein